MKNTIITLIKISIIIFVFLFCFVQYFIIKEYITDRKAVNENKKVDYVIILGARVKGENPTKSLMERIKAAIEYLKKNPEVKVIATGGQGKNEGVAEGLAIKRELLKNGISEDRIILEDKSKNTVENFRFSLEKIENIENSKNILITFK